MSGNSRAPIDKPWASVENFHKELKGMPRATRDVCNEK